MYCGGLWRIEACGEPLCLRAVALYWAVLRGIVWCGVRSGSRFFSSFNCISAHPFRQCCAADAVDVAKGSPQCIPHTCPPYPPACAHLLVVRQIFGRFFLCAGDILYFRNEG